MSGASALAGGVGRSVRDMVRRTRSVLLACALVCGAVACSGDDDDAAGDLALYCDKAKAVDALEAGFQTEELPDPATLKAEYEALVAAADEAMAAAPAEIAEQVGITKAAVEALTKVLEDNDFDLVAAAGDPAFAELTANPDYEAAGTAVDEFNQRECGIAAS